MAKKKTGGGGTTAPFSGPTGIRHGYGEGEWNSNQKAKLRGETPGAAPAASSRPVSFGPVSTGTAAPSAPKTFQVGGTTPPSNSPPSTSFQARYNPGGGGSAPSAPTPSATPATTPAAATPARVRAAGTRAHTPRPPARPTATPAAGPRQSVSLSENVARGGVDLRREASAPSWADTTTQRLSAPLNSRETRVGAPPSRTGALRVPPNMSVATQPGRQQGMQPSSNIENGSEDHTLRNIGVGAAVVGGLTLAATRSPRVAAMAARAAPALGAAARSVGPRIAAAAPGMARSAVSGIRSAVGSIFSRGGAKSTAGAVARSIGRVVAPEVAGRGVEAATGSSTAGDVARTATAIGVGGVGGPGGARGAIQRMAGGAVGSLALGAGGGALGAMADRHVGDGRGHGGEALGRSVGSILGAGAGSSVVRGRQTSRSASVAPVATRRATMAPTAGPRATAGQSGTTTPPPAPDAPSRQPRATMPSPTPGGRTDNHWEEGMMQRAGRSTRTPAPGSAATDPQPQFDQRNVEARRGERIRNNEASVPPRPTVGPARRQDTSPEITEVPAQRTPTMAGSRADRPARASTLPPNDQSNSDSRVTGRTAADRQAGMARRAGRESEAPVRGSEAPASVQVASSRESPVPPAPAARPAGTVRRPVRGGPGVASSARGTGTAADLVPSAQALNAAARRPVAPSSSNGREGGESASAVAARRRRNEREGFAGPSGINHGAFSQASGGGLVRGEPNLTQIKSNHGFGRSNVKF